MKIRRKNTEQEELIKAKQQAGPDKRTKEIFSANMSHEIRSPLNSIISLLDLLKNTNLDEEQANIICLLEVSSSLLLGIVNDVLDLSKIEAGKFKIVRADTNIIKLGQSIVDLMKLVASEKGLDLIFKADPNIPDVIYADSLRLNQILMNLLSNAIKFTSNGCITLEIRVLNKKDNHLHLEFLVIDTGIGIPSASLGKIFDSFEQAEDDTAHKFGGTGLGLSIVKKLTELKGGTLALTSEVGQGSQFCFSNWYQIVEVKSKPA